MNGKIYNILLAEYKRLNGFYKHWHSYYVDATEWNKEEKNKIDSYLNVNWSKHWNYIQVEKYKPHNAWSNKEYNTADKRLLSKEDFFNKIIRRYEVEKLLNKYKKEKHDR